MKHDFKKSAGSKIELTVTLEDKEFAGYYASAEEAAASEITIKGFRKGAAPKEMIAGAIDHDKVFHQAINEAIRWSLNQIKIENNWTFIDQPKIEVTDGEPGKGISYKATLTVFPEVTLADYKKIAQKVFAEKTPVVISDEEVKKTIEWVRSSRATETRAPRAAKIGDLVEADIDTEIDGKPVPKGSFQGDRFILGESNFIKGFDENLVGKNENDVIRFSLVAPADYWNEELRGKQLDFTVTLRGVFERALPELTDTFVQGLSAQFKTVADFEKSVREGLAMEKQEKETEKLRIKALDTIAKESKMDIPEILVERTLEDMMQDYARYMPKDGDAKKQEQFMNDLRAKTRERAETSVRGNLVMYKLAQAENLVPTAEEIEAEAAHHNVDPEKEHDYIYSALQNKKVFEFLERQAQ